MFEEEGADADGKFGGEGGEVFTVKGSGGGLVGFGEEGEDGKAGLVRVKVSQAMKAGSWGLAYRCLGHLQPHSASFNIPGPEIRFLLHCEQFSGPVRSDVYGPLDDVVGLLFHAVYSEVCCLLHLSSDGCVG